jgi:hypothetical protein
MTKSNVIQLDEHRRGNDSWEEVFTTDGPNSTLQVYVNKKTGEIDIVQMNDDNEAIRTSLDPVAREELARVLTNKKA